MELTSDQEISRHLDIFNELTIKLRDLKPELLVSNPNQWVGVGEDREVVFADSLNDLVDKLREGHDKDYIIAIEYLDPDPIPLVI